MRVFGIIGFPLSHSFSPAYFNRRFAEEGIDARYEAFPIGDIGLLPELLAAQPDLCGLNVTIPYKTTVMPFLHQLSADAAAIGAVNCIRIKDGQLYGYNTDHKGFSESLKPLLPPGAALEALILGTGGSAKAVAYALEQLGIPFRFVSRTPLQPEVLAYAQLDESMLSRCRIIINTTPSGMFPHTDQCPDIPYALLGSMHILYDLVYNPAMTLFLQQGADRGASIKNGADMLRIQAEYSWELWNRD